MRQKSVRGVNPNDLRRSLERLSGLPLRPTSARAVIDSAPLDHDEPGAHSAPLCTDFDPGWALARFCGLANPLEIVAEAPWWKLPATTAEAVGRLWRNSVAVSLAARRLAREANDRDPGAVARAALLYRFGLWALVAVEPERLAAWLAIPDGPKRRAYELETLGTEVSSLGREIAARIGGEPLLEDATWLFNDHAGLLAAHAQEPERLRFIQQAHAYAEQTPWALSGASVREGGPLEPRIRLLMAEVQSRCGAEFVEADATAREERLTRENAALRVQTAKLKAGQESQDRLIAALANTPPHERPEVWADRVALGWCDAPGVSAAKIAWVENASATEKPSQEAPASPARPATTRLPLGTPGRAVAEVHLWHIDQLDEPTETLAAWDTWAALVADRARLRKQLDLAIDTLRTRAETEEAERHRAKLDALGEFAAGAGHELNNPLAVILGRAQLLLTRANDAESLRSLRAIVTQAQRAHRILRDLMYVARPPEPRPRLCVVDDVLRASVRDAQAEAESRGVRLLGDPRQSTGLRIWADPEALRHVADILIRNALEATPSGGQITVGSLGDERQIRWLVKDTGRGLVAHEAAHLFDPFFCGRQAGRGLGLGLPRASRFAEKVGGEISWQSSVSGGTTFAFKFPAVAPPSVSTTHESDAPPRSDRTLPA